MTMTTTRILAAAAASTALLAAMQGRLARVMGASMACPDWPLCQGRLIPEMNRLVFVEWMHRSLVLLTTVLVLAVAVAAWRQRGAVRALGVLALGFLLATALIGGVSILRPIHPLFAAIDQGLAMLTFGTLVALAGRQGRLRPATIPRSASRS